MALYNVNQTGSWSINYPPVSLFVCMCGGVRVCVRCLCANSCVFVMFSLGSVLSFCEYYVYNGLQHVNVIIVCDLFMFWT